MARWVSWLFSGTGNILLTDGTNQFNRKVSFVSLVYGVRASKEQKIFNLNSFTVKNLGNSSIQASFAFGYNLPLFLNSLQPVSRQGLKYEALVMYPDNTYLDLNGVIYDPQSQETITFPPKVNSGKIRVFVMLSDFPALVEERDLDL